MTERKGKGRMTPTPEKKSRQQLPDTHTSVVHKTKIGKVSIYLLVGLFDDGSPSEIFIKVDDKTIRGWCNCLGIFISISLQAGVPLKTIIKHLRYQKFDPSGFTENEDIKSCSSIPDYIGRWLEREFG